MLNFHIFHDESPSRNRYWGIRLDVIALCVYSFTSALKAGLGLGSGFAITGSGTL